MEFDVGKVQMKFLHLLSSEASHSITLHCLSDPPHSTNGSLPQENIPLRFRGWNKQMFEKDTLLEPHVLQDECKVTSRTENLAICFRIVFNPNATYLINLEHEWLLSLFSTRSLSDPRWQLAPVTFLLPYSGQLSATHCRRTGVSHITAQESAAFRNQPGVLPLTPTSPPCYLFTRNYWKARLVQKYGCLAKRLWRLWQIVPLVGDQ